MLYVFASALAAPLPVVAIGDGLGAGPPPSVEAGSATVPGGWVPVLADCLEERAPKRFTVVDRAVAGETVATARPKIVQVRELGAAWVIVTLGAQELSDEALDPKKLKEDLAGLIGELKGKKGPKVLLVGLVPPTLSQVDGADAARQPALDERTAKANVALSELAAASDAVKHLDLWTDWPHEGPGRAALTQQGWSLSDQGHARVAAAVCDTLLR